MSNRQDSARALTPAPDSAKTEGVHAITQEFPGMPEAVPVDTFKITPENLRKMADAMREEDGLLNFTQAATLLGVVKQRIQQLATTGQLRRFSFCGQHYVSYREVCARRDADIKIGRPRRTPVEALAVNVKAALQTDKAQASLGGFRGKRK